MATERQAARVFVIADRSVLLIKGLDPAHPEEGTWWFTPGGGIHEGETVEAAASRELREETGLHRDPEQMGTVVATRVAEFDFDDVALRQTESFFVVRVDPFTPTVDGWDDIERDAVLEFRWWTVGELVATDDRLYPAELAEVVRTLIDGAVDEAMQLSGD